MCDKNFDIFKDKIFRKDDFKLARIGFGIEAPLLTFEEELQLVLLLKCNFIDSNKPTQPTELFARQTVIDFCMMQNIPAKTNQRIVSREYVRGLTARHPYLHQVIYPEETPESLYANCKQKTSTLPSLDDLAQKFNTFKEERKENKAERRDKDVSRPIKVAPQQFPEDKIIDEDDEGRIYIRDIEEQDLPRDLYFFLWHNYRGYTHGCSVNMADNNVPPAESLLSCLRDCQSRALSLKYDIWQSVTNESPIVYRDSKRNSCSYVREIASGLSAYPEDARVIGLKITDTALTNIKWIVRNFYECRSANATATNNCSQEDSITIIAHLKYFVEHMETPQRKMKQMPCYVRNTTLLHSFLRTIFLRDSLDWHYPTAYLHAIYNSVPNNIFPPMELHTFGEVIRSTFPDSKHIRLSYHDQESGTYLLGYCNAGVRPINNAQHREPSNVQFLKYLSPWLSEIFSIEPGKTVTKTILYENFMDYVIQRDPECPLEDQWRHRIASFLKSRNVTSNRTNYINITPLPVAMDVN